jgi:Na+/H+-translocating membrane pyrophosphatase
MLAAVQRASADFLWQETRLLALLVGIVLAVVAVPLVALAGAGTGNAGLAWSLAASGLGALAGCGIAHFSHWSAARSAQRSLGALRQDRNLTVGVTLRGASVLAVAIDSASSALTCLVFVAHYAYLTLRAQVQPEEALVVAGRSLAALAFGALCAAVVFHVGGTSLHTAAGVAATGARARDPRIARDEERNPVLVAELVGDHVGGVVSRSSDVFAGLLLTNAAVCMLGARVAQSSAASRVLVSDSWAPQGTNVPAGVALVALPLLIRTLGQFAASVALASSRFEGLGGAGRANPGMLLGARASHAVLLLAGTFGATVWLLGASPASVWVFAGALGVLAGALSAAVSVVGLGAGRRAPIGGSRSGPTVARAFGLGLQRTWVSCALVAACLGGAWMIGARAASSSLAHGGAFALALAVAALLGSGAFDASTTLFAAFSDSVHKLAALRRSRFDEGAKQRAADMARAAVAIGHMGRTQTALGGAAAALLGAVMLSMLGSGSGLSWAHPMVLLGALLGAGSLSFHVGGMLKASSRTATSLDKELADRLAHEGLTERETSSGPLPGYRESVQLASKSSTEALVPMALGALLVPFLVATGIRLIYGAAGGPVVAYGLMAFSALATLAGCSAALVAQGTSLELAEARRTGGASNPSSLIEFLERCIGPAALLGSRATVVSSLAAVPLLI